MPILCFPPSRPANVADDLAVGNRLVSPAQIHISDSRTQSPFSPVSGRKSYMLVPAKNGDVDWDMCTLGAAQPPAEPNITGARVHALGKFSSACDSMRGTFF